MASQDLDDITFPSDLQIADPIINNPHTDLLIGARLFWDLLCVGEIRLRAEGPVLQKTLLG